MNPRSLIAAAAPVALSQQVSAADNNARLFGHWGCWKSSSP